MGDSKSTTQQPQQRMTRARVASSAVTRNARAMTAAAKARSAASNTSNTTSATSTTMGASRATAPTASTSLKRKTRDDDDEEDDHHAKHRLAPATAARPVTRPVRLPAVALATTRATRARARNPVNEVSKTSRPASSESAKPASSLSTRPASSASSRPPVTTATRGRPPTKAQEPGDKAIRTTRSVQPDHQSSSTATSRNTSTTRTRPTGSTATAPTAASKALAKPAIKKTVKFEEPEKENIGPPGGRKKKAGPIANTGGLRAKPVRTRTGTTAKGSTSTAKRGAANGATNRPVSRNVSRSATPNDAPENIKVEGMKHKPLPLSPKKVNQLVAAAKHGDDSEDELAIHKNSPALLQPLLTGRAPIKPPAPKTSKKAQEKQPEEGQPQEPEAPPASTSITNSEPEEQNKDASAEPTVLKPHFLSAEHLSMLASPARRPPPSPWKNSIKTPAKRVEGLFAGVPLLANRPDGQPVAQPAKSGPSLLASPAKRPPGIANVLLGGDVLAGPAITSTNTGTMGPPSFLASPAKRVPISAVKTQPSVEEFAAETKNSLLASPPVKFSTSRRKSQRLEEMAREQEEHKEQETAHEEEEEEQDNQDQADAEMENEKQVQEQEQEDEEMVSTDEEDNDGPSGELGERTMQILTTASAKPARLLFTGHRRSLRSLQKEAEAAVQEPVQEEPEPQAEEEHDQAEEEQQPHEEQQEQEQGENREEEQEVLEAQEPEQDLEEELVEEQEIDHQVEAEKHKEHEEHDVHDEEHEAEQDQDHEMMDRDEEQIAEPEVIEPETDEDLMEVDEVELGNESVEQIVIPETPQPENDDQSYLDTDQSISTTPPESPPQHLLNAPSFGNLRQDVLNPSLESEDATPAPPPRGTKANPHPAITPSMNTPHRTPSGRSTTKRICFDNGSSGLGFTPLADQLSGWKGGVTPAPPKVNLLKTVATPAKATPAKVTTSDNASLGFTPLAEKLSGWHGGVTPAPLKTQAPAKTPALAAKNEVNSSLGFTSLAKQLSGWNGGVTPAKHNAAAPLESRFNRRRSSRRLQQVDEQEESLFDVAAMEQAGIFGTSVARQQQQQKSKESSPEKTMEETAKADAQTSADVQVDGQQQQKDLDMKATHEGEAVKMAQHEEGKAEADSAATSEPQVDEAPHEAAKIAEGEEEQEEGDSVETVMADADQAYVDSDAMIDDDDASPILEDIPITNEDVELAAEAEALARMSDVMDTTDGGDRDGSQHSISDNLSEASQEYGDENAVPVMAEFITRPLNVNLYTPADTSNRVTRRASAALAHPTTPVRPQVAVREVHTVSKVPLKVDDGSTAPPPRPLRPRRSGRSSLSRVSFADTADVIIEERQEEMETVEEGPEQEEHRPEQENEPVEVHIHQTPVKATPVKQTPTQQNPFKTPLKQTPPQVVAEQTEAPVPSPPKGHEITTDESGRQRRRSRRISSMGAGASLAEIPEDDAEFGSPIAEEPEPEDDEEDDFVPSEPVTPAKSEVEWSAMDTPARTPHKDLNPKLLRGAVVYCDVHTAEGADASGLFIELLGQMGARCVKNWTWNPDAGASGDEPASRPGHKIGITHVVFKDGSKRTLEKIKESQGVVQCVGVSWVLDCERENKWLDEADYLIDLSFIPRGGARRRKSMEPKALANLNGTLVPSGSGSGSNTTTTTTSTTKITTTTTTTTTNLFSSSTTTRQTQQQHPTTPGNTTSTGRSKRRSSSLWVRTPPSPDASSFPGDENRRVSDSILAMSTTSKPVEEDEEEEREWTSLSPIPKTPAPETVARLAANLSPASSTTDFGGDVDIGDGGFLIPADEQGHEAEFLREAMPEHHDHGMHAGGAMTCPPKPSLGYAVPSTSSTSNPSTGRAGRGLFSKSIGPGSILPGLPEEMEIDSNNPGSGVGGQLGGGMPLSAMAGTMGLLRGGDNRERNLGVMMRLSAARRKSLQFAPKVGSPLARSWTGNNNGNNGGLGGGAGGTGGVGGSGTGQVQRGQ